MKKKNIFQNQSQEILTLFEDAKDRAKVMCIPMDYAKKDHLVMFCNGNGKIIRKPFSIKNSLEGKNYLTDQVRKSCHHHGINLKHTFFGGEDCGSYVDNFITALRLDNWLVAGVNARDAKTYRDNMQASTDLLDLSGICKMLLSCKGNCSPAQSGIYLNLRLLVRQRRQFVKMRTEVKNRIYTLVDRIFPGFLDEKKSGIIPFSKASLFLMEDRFSVHEIQRRQRPALVRLLYRFGMHNPERSADKLSHLVRHVLKPPENAINTLQISLTHEIGLFKCLQKNIKRLENNIAQNLAQTQGAFLTSIKGIGIILAAGVSAEIGNPDKQKSLSNLVSYAGIVPRIKQTGGIQGKVYVKKVGKRCNRILKDYLVQSACHIGKHGPEDLMLDHKKRDTQGQHADFGIARRYLRMAMCLMKTSQTYLPEMLRNKNIDKNQRAEYYLGTWSILYKKWSQTKALKIAFDKNNPLGKWSNMIQEIYGIKFKI